MKNKKRHASKKNSHGSENYTCESERRAKSTIEKTHCYDDTIDTKRERLPNNVAH